MSQCEFTQRQIKREKEERIGRYVRQITRSCKDMPKKKLKEVEAFNSSILQDKHKRNKCFYFKEIGHFIRTCPKKIPDDAESADKHPNASLERKKEINSAQPEENFLVSNLEKQKKFLFTYGMGEFIIKPVFQAYLLPRVYFAPEVSLNILSIDLLKQQGFEVVSDRDRYRLEYMFKEPTGNILYLNKLRQMQNNFLEDYFEGLDENQDRKKDEMVRVEEDMNSSEVHTFHEFVAFLNLIKNDELTARAPEVPAKAKEDSSLESYQWNIGKTCAPLAVQKGKEKLEHLAIKLEEEEVYKEQQPAYYGKDQITCYRCHNFRHYAHECPNKSKDQGNYTSYKEPSTDKRDSSSSNTSKDFTIIT
nr:ARID DNA-binding domain-containing protein [Tanacetum cinerariifolium]